MSLNLVPPPIDDDAAFERKYEAWPLRQRINLPPDQLRTICQIFFNFGCAHGVKVQAQLDEMICADIDAVFS